MEKLIRFFRGERHENKPGYFKTGFVVLADTVANGVYRAGMPKLRKRAKKAKKEYPCLSDTVEQVTKFSLVHAIPALLRTFAVSSLSFFSWVASHHVELFSFAIRMVKNIFRKGNHKTGHAGEDVQLPDGWNEPYNDNGCGGRRAGNDETKSAA